MINRTVLARTAWLISVAVLSAFSQVPAWAANLTLGWNSCGSASVAGYEVVYGPSSHQYISSIDAGTNTSATVPNLAPGTTFYFAILAYDVNGNEGPLSTEIQASIPNVEVELQITSQPVNQTVAAGSTVVFNVGVAGTAPLTYQWFHNELPVPGATSPALMLPNISDANAGYYNVLIINSGGVALSSVVTLTVLDLPVITSQPVGQSVNAGSTAVFTVSATSQTPLTYQWYNNSATVSGATSATLSLANVSDVNGGNYSVVVANNSGSVTSSAATLSVNDAPAITSPPSTQTAAIGSSAVFRVGVYGTPPFTFQWYFNNTPISGAQSRTLFLTNVSAANAGNYFVVVLNALGMARSTAAELFVTSSYASVAGTYNGLFCLTNSTNGLAKIRVPSAGLLGNCVVGTNGVYSASISLGGFSYPLSGTLNTSGYDREVISRAANGLSNLTVTLNLDMSSASQAITGSVSNMDAEHPWNAPLTALLATNALPVPPGAWYLTIPPAVAGQPNSPQGYAIISVSPAGVATLIGRLYDGSQIVQSIPVAGNGAFPLYISLYGGSGVIAGWASMSGGLPTGAITWIRPTGASSPIPYANGFTNVVNIY